MHVLVTSMKSLLTFATKTKWLTGPMVNLHNVNRYNSELWIKNNINILWNILE